MNIFMIRLLVIFMLLGATSAQAKEEVSFLTYHNAPPFIIDHQQKIGLSFDLAELLTKNSNGRYDFVLKPLPRLRLNRTIHSISNYVVPWVNPAWFKDKNREIYQWSDAYFKDSNTFISHTSNSFEYRGPTSMIGYSLAGLRGGRWAGLDPLINDQLIEKIEVSNFEGVVKLVAGGRVDGGILPRSVADYYINNDLKLIQQVVFSKRNHSDYQRHFLICHCNGLTHYIHSEVKKLKTSPEWQALLKKYNLSQN